MKTISGHVTICLVLIAVSFFAYGCIKEDRSMCPCWLTVDLSSIEVPDKGLSDMALRVNCNRERNSEGYAFRVSDIVPVSDDMTSVEYKVPRGTAYISVISGNLQEEGGVLVIPEGQQMVPLYGCFDIVGTRRESAYCRVGLHKEFCNLSIKFSDEDYVCPYRVSVCGNVCGVSVFDLLPYQGTFRYEPESVDGTYRVRIPRQLDNSLTMRLSDGNEIVAEFPVGEYIAAGGYDWTAADLEDIEITIDLHKQEIIISVNGWEKVLVNMVI